MVAAGISISQGTIYRVLKEMELVGLVIREWEPGISGYKATYMIRPWQANHSACCLLCRRCERSITVNDADLYKKVGQAAAANGLAAIHAPLTIQFTCGDCQPMHGWRPN